MDTNKTQRILQMLMLLSGGKHYHLEDLMNKFGMSERNLMRDLKLIDEAGFLLERQDGYHLLADNANNKNLKRLLHFSEEEIAILYQTLSMIEGTSPVKERLIRKMNTFYDIRVLNRLQQSDDLEKVHLIGDSIKRKKQIKLNSYRSSNSGNIGDRIVEAFGFLSDYQTVWCYDCYSHDCKQFKISRMQAVSILANDWRFETEHRQPFTDIFRYSEDAPQCTLELRLTLKAYNALIEEYPRSVNDIRTEEGSLYYLKTPVANFTGVGRFVMSMLEDVEIIRPASFKNYIRKRVEKFLKR